MTKSHPTVYERIMKAARLHKGIRLSMDEVFQLSMDHAIISRAEQDEEGINDHSLSPKEEREYYERQIKKLSNIWEI